MADETSHTFLLKGLAPAPKTPASLPPPRSKYYESFVDFVSDKDLHDGVPSRNEIASFAKEPWRTEQQEAHNRDLELQRETQGKQQRIKAAFPDAPHSIIALAGEYAEVRDFLVGLIPKEG